jgi:hypothetical protein
MYIASKPSVFTQMNKATMKMDSGNYRSWKQKDPLTGEQKPMNPASFTEFPDLVKSAPKKTVFEGTSLASKLKDVIAAEEEAAVQKRLKKGETPDQILRELCVVLPLNGSKSYTMPTEVPWWVTDDSKPIVLPPFKPKSHLQLAEERRWKRLGVNPTNLSLYDESPEDKDDGVSLPSLSDHEDEPEEDEFQHEELPLQ